MVKKTNNPQIGKTAVLAINTTQDLAVVYLRVGAKQFTRQWQSAGRIEDLLKQINLALKQARLKPEDISEIKVNPGPGSFIGARGGVTVANTLGWLLKVPVNGKKPPIAVKYQ